MTKEFGAAVSGYNLPEGRAWETVVFEAGKPVLDRELNLSQDVDGGAAQESLRRVIPSGWLADDFLTSSSPVDGVFTASALANTIEINNGLLAHVNGWLVKVQHSYATGTNQLDLGAGPAGVGAQRTDIVVLEVWRKLISASPDTDGKSTLGRIWQEGNVATDPANDAVLNYADDLLDANVGSETTKRVQIQYRLRVVTGVDLAAFPYGLDDPSVVAYTVPPNAATPNGAATAYTYANQSTSGDPGLWIAGDGNPANGLGTVDGYMYAIPVVAVFRRNTSAFERRTNHNGGVASPGPSDRPDGLFHDIIGDKDVMDLRMGVSASGWTLPEVLNKNVNFLLDNNLHSEFENSSPYGGGNTGTTVLIANEIGISNGNGGDGNLTGVTGSGELVRQFDAVCRRFSDRAILETATIVIPAPGGVWAPGSSVSVDPTSMAIFPYSAFNWSAYAPADVRFLDVLDMRWVGDSPSISALAEGHLESVTDLGRVPITPLTITFETIEAGITNEDLHVTVLIGYPTGVGLSKTPIEDYGTDSFSINNPGQLPAFAPVSYDSLLVTGLDHPHREAQLEYQTVSLTTSFTALANGPLGGGNSDTIFLSERAESVSAVRINAIPAGGFALAADGRTITGLAMTPGDDIEVDYVARRPLPQNDEQITIYYRAAAVQTARNALLSGSITVIPKVHSQSMYVLTTGSGSQDNGYPFPTAYVQTGGIYPSLSATYSGEGELSGRSEISVADFDAQTGLLTLPVYLPMVADPESLIFNRGIGDIDVEGRTFFKEVPVGYVPNAYSQNLSNPDRHKDIFPILAELAEDSILGYRGQLVLILIVRYALFDSTNGVFFDSDLNSNTTTASIFRVKGNLLGKRNS